MPAIVVVNPGLPAISGAGTVPRAVSTGAAVPIVNVTDPDVALPPGPVVRMLTDVVRGTARAAASIVACNAGSVCVTTVTAPVALTTFTGKPAVVNVVGSGLPSNTI